MKPSIIPELSDALRSVADGFNVAVASDIRGLTFVITILLYT